MRKELLYLVIGLFISLNLHALPYQVAADSLNNDGPFVFFTGNKLKVMWIENNVKRGQYISEDNFNEFSDRFNLPVSYNDLWMTSSLKPKNRQNYSHVDRIGVITDIHGEFDTYVKLLKSTGIIDKNLNWKFGKGHLVVVGDIFDRGNMVNEVLWHLFGLEKQAEKAGGMVHVMLGNHEFMVLRKDLSYVNPKYSETESISKIRYYDQYSDNSVIGKWLRSKPVIITINNIIFVHAGISMEMVQRNLTVEEINRKFSDNILGKNLKEVNCDEELFFLNETNGPLWYRGYFLDTTFCESKIDSILAFFGKDHIVVGHTASEGINSLFHNKILGADTGIMNKQSKEMLLYKNGYFYRSLLTGARIRL
jgi:hypothetical protein